MDDFNLHHLAWREIGAKINNNFEIFLALVAQYSFHLLIKTGIITYNETRHQSTIDLIFISTIIFERLITCKILLNDKYGFNHRPILSLFNMVIFDQEMEPWQQFKETDVKVLRKTIL